ncbi:hypothetical protein M0802_014466 [Mischocyttarus mexicanus]|nr:hypothetical protein M0802_014470 [Mischocyttarus mexicanus]KAI4479053.1 hypothetical protein M0802_014466 [Mischocyttarus mexicanus]
MDCLDDESLEFSDKDENSILQPSTSNVCNPVEEYLEKQLSSLQDRIDRTKNDVEDLRDEIKSISNSFFFKLIHGYDKGFDSDSEMYTTEGEPVIKKKVKSKPCNFLILKDHWQYVLLDKWVIGAVLQNVSFQ